METNQRQSDELNWKIAGIRDERARVEARLKYLVEQEQQLVNGGMTKAAPVKAKVKAVRKRVMSAETREKMRAAARKRWHKPETAPAPAPIEVPAAQ